MSKKTKSENNKAKAYGIFNNLRYIIAENNKFNKKFVLFSFISIPFAAVTSVIAAYLPKVVLDCVSHNDAPKAMLIKLGIFSAVTVIFGICQNILSRFLLYSRRLMGTVYFHSKVCEKIIKMD